MSTVFCRFVHVSLLFVENRGFRTLLTQFGLSTGALSIVKNEATRTLTQGTLLDPPIETFNALKGFFFLFALLCLLSSQFLVA